MSKYKYLVQRCEWIVAFTEVDQYGTNTKLYKTFPFPTREEAQAFLPTVAHEHKFVKDRWVPNDAPHVWCEAYITVRHEFVKEYWE